MAMTNTQRIIDMMYDPKSMGKRAKDNRKLAALKAHKQRLYLLNKSKG